MLRNLSLRVLIRIVFLVVLALALVFGFALYFLLQSQKEVELNQETRYQSFNSSNMIRMYSLELSNEIRNYAVTEDSAKLTSYEAILAKTLGKAPRVDGQTISNDALLKNLPLNTTERQLLEKGVAATNTMAAIEEKAIALVKAGRAQEALKLVTGPEYSQGRVDMAESVNTAISNLISRLEANLADANAYNQRLVMLMVGLVLLFVALSLLLGWTLNRLVLQPLGAEPSEMERVVTAIAGGDLSLKFSANATGVYARLQSMTERLREVIGHIHQSSETLSAAAEETSAISTQTSTHLNRLQLDTEQVVAAINEMSATVQEVSHNTSAAAASAGSAKDAANEGREVVGQTVASISKLSDEVIATGLVVQSLAESSNQISSVVQVIQDIADRTNLLALNAAIESARAGEMGRGFAVVADEVRELAGQTQLSSQKIITIVTKLQSDAKQAIAAMDAGRLQTELTVAQAQEAEQALELIDSSVLTINDMNTQIAAAVEQQAMVTEDISRNLTMISEVGDQTAAGAEQTATASQELTELAAGLQELVQGFRLG